jgi:hypothetical protein
MRNLVFFDPTVAGCMQSLRALERAQAGKIVLHAWNDFAKELVGQARELSFVLLGGEPGQIPHPGVEVVKAMAPGDILLANEFDPEKLSSILIEYLDAANATILAPVSAHYYLNRALFIISIPKGGTHLLFKLVESLGYKAGVVHDGNPNPGAWYCVEYSNTHTVARDFFVDTVRREPFGNRHHPFPRTPSLFIYRSPLDIVVSEANYYQRDGATVFSAYLRRLDFAQRLLRLIDDPYLLGSIRDRINNFVAWLEFENVIPVSFEELIGSKGGGDDAVRNRLIWSLQLKLHIPGNPDKLGAGIYNEDSPTFHEGLIGSWRNKITPEGLARFFSLNQDFMELTGYAKPTPPPGEATPISDGVNLIPARAEEFRRRPLRTSGETFQDVPVNVEWSFLGHNLVRFDGRYYALPRGAGPVDLVKLRSRNKLGRVLSAPDLQRLKALIVMRSRNKLGNLVSRLKLLSTLDVQTLKALISKALG